MDLNKKQPGKELTERELDKILLEIGIFNDEKRKMYMDKIMAIAMMGIFMDVMMGKGEDK